MDRSWMYNMTNFGRMGLRPEFVEGVIGFVEYAKTLDPFQRSGMIKCPCNKCQCLNYEKPDAVELHIYRNGFKKEYTVWTSHGEIDNNFDVFQHYVPGESSSNVNSNAQNYRIDDMIQDAFGVHSDFDFANQGEEAPNVECKIFFEQLESASRPLYEGSPHSQLSIAVRLLSIKSDWSVPQGAMDSVIDLIHDLVDPNLEIPDNFYKAKRLVSKLGMSSMRIHCCENGCMLYYKDDIDLESCKFCGKCRYKQTASGKKVPIKAMHYLPLIPRLKRLYASNRSAPHMRWHHEHRRPPQEQDERVWLDLTSGPSRYGYAYGMPHKTFREFSSEFEGLNSSNHDESMKKNLAMEKKIVELSSQAEESRARERRLELQFAGLKAQFDALLASGGIPPCSGDVTFPPRPPQSQPTHYPMYGQQRNMTHESSDEESDEESDDYVENTLPH